MTVSTVSGSVWSSRGVKWLSSVQEDLPHPSEPGPVCGPWAYLLGGLSLGTGKVRGGKSRKDITVNRLGGCSPGDLAWLLATPSF